MSGETGACGLRNAGGDPTGRIEQFRRLLIAEGGGARGRLQLEERLKYQAEGPKGVEVEGHK